MDGTLPVGECSWRLPVPFSIVWEYYKRLIVIRKICFLFLSLVTVSTVAAQGVVAVDGPYIMYDGDRAMRYMATAPDGSFVDTVYARIPERLAFTVVSDDGGYSFDVNIRPGGGYSRLPSEVDVEGDIIVLSDPHGDFVSLLSVLRNNGTVGESLEWTFGQGTLVIIGDVFDRGKDVNTILWFVEKLRQEAERAGGRVIFQIGNHEDIVLKGNYRYTEDKYKEFAGRAGVSLRDLYGKDSELGRLIRSANIVSRLNDNVIVHAGLGGEFFRRGLSFDEVNGMVDDYLGVPNDSLAVIGGDEEFVFRTVGPLWYRGMVRDDDTEKYPPVSMATLDSALNRLGASRVIVGHTVFGDVTQRLGGRVVAVNVDSRKNRAAGRGRGLLIRDGRLYVIFDDKVPALLDSIAE